MSNCNHTRDQSSLHGDECSQCLHDKIARAKADAAAWSKSFHDANAERLALKAKLDGLQRHHDLCRAEAGAPDDDVLLESIKTLKADHACAEDRLDKAIDEGRALKAHNEWLRNILDDGKGQSAVSILWQDNKRLLAALECCVHAITHPNSNQKFALDAAQDAIAATPAPVVPLADAEMLASALERIAWATGDTFPALSAYRSRHPAPKETPP